MQSGLVVGESKKQVKRQKKSIYFKYILCCLFYLKIGKYIFIYQSFDVGPIIFFKSNHILGFEVVNHNYNASLLLIAVFD